MSRSSDTRCLYCNGKIPLLQRLKNSQFCSSAHEQTYRTEQQELAVERLHQTHDSLQAYKPPEDVESILGPLSIPQAPTPTTRNTIGGIANGGGEPEEPKRHQPKVPGSEAEPYNPDEPSDFRPSWENLSGETMYTEEERLAPPRPQSQSSPIPQPAASDDELSELDQFLRDTAALDKFSSKDLDLDDLAPEKLSASPKPDPSAMRHFMPQPKRPEPEPAKNDFTESLLDRLGVQEGEPSRDLHRPQEAEPQTPAPEPQEEPVSASPLDRLMQASEAPASPEPEPEEPVSIFYDGPEASRMAELLPQGEPDGPYGVLPAVTPTPVAAEQAAFGGQDEHVPAGVLLGEVGLEAPVDAFDAGLPLVSRAQLLAGPESRDTEARSTHRPELEFEASSLGPARPDRVGLEVARPDVLSAAYLEELKRRARKAQDEAGSPKAESVAKPTSASEPKPVEDEPVAGDLKQAPERTPEQPVAEAKPSSESKPIPESKPVAKPDLVAEPKPPASEKITEPEAKRPQPEPKKPVSGIWISEELFGISTPKQEAKPEVAEPKSAADVASEPEPVSEAKPVTADTPEEVKAASEQGARVEIENAEPEQAEEIEAEAATADETVEAVEEETLAAEAVQEETIGEEDVAEEPVEEIEEPEPSLAGLAALLASEPRDSVSDRDAESWDTDPAEPVSFEPEAGLPQHEVEPEAVPVPVGEEEEPDPAWASTMPLPGPKAMPAARSRSVASEVTPLETEELLIWADLEMTPAVGGQRDLWRLNESLCALNVQGSASKQAAPRKPMTAPLTGTILFPKVRLEPEPFKSASPGGGVDRMMGPPPRTPMGGAGANKKKRKSMGPGGMLGGVKGFWTHAPRDLKILLLVIPALLALVFHPSLPKISVSAPDTSSGVTADVKDWFDNNWTEVRAAIASRAGVALEEDFRQGLDQWISRGGATTHWSFDQTGFVKPGPLALYAPSMNLVDYQMQFLGMIDKGALSWVVRAKDFRNYYVVKLTVRQEGALPIIFVTRYAVIDGVAMDRVDTHVPIDARADTLYRVRMDVKGDDFTLAVQDQVVDTWEDPRLDRGGIGFYTGRGEESRVRWVQLTHQYDMLGRLCAYLAPYNPSPAAGAEVAGSF